MRSKASNPRSDRAHARAGFTLLELLIAMTVTLIVSGAIFGLIAGGNNAFRREPELTDRQQNIRVAMDLITRDVGAAGVDMSPWAQVFSFNDLGIPLDGAGPAAPGGGNSDYLEIFGSRGECPAMPVEKVAGTNTFLPANPPSCFKPFPTLVHFAWPPDQTYVGFACEPGAGDGAGTDFNFPSGQAPGVNWPGGGGLPRTDPPDHAPPDGTTVGKLQVARYEIAADPADGVPSLWRSETGRAPINGTCGVGGGGGGGGGTGGGAGETGTGVDWRMVARGIEDLQVRYVMADGTVGESPVAVVSSDYRTLVREVEVTLVARVMKQRLQGETAGASGTGTYVRASLTSTLTPRTVLATLRGAPPGGSVAPWK